MRPCIVGVGEPLAGDDAVGIRVVERLREGGGASDAELYTLRDPSELTTLLPGRSRALVVDALLAPDRAGTVEVVELERGRTVLPETRRSLSSHGVDSLMAIELGRVLAGSEPFPRVSLLTIAIARPIGLGGGLSAAAERAVDLAVARALTWSAEASRARD